MWIAIGLIALGIGLLVFGGEMLLRGSVSLATLLKLTPAVIGLTVVAVGTSIPELAVSAIATAHGEVDIAIANVVGSNIFNIGVIVGLSAIIAPLTISGNTIKLEYPVLAIVSLLCLVVCQDGYINWLDAVLFIVIYAGFTAYLVGLVREQVTAQERQEFQAEVAELQPQESKPQIGWSLGLVGFGAICLALGAHSTVHGAVEIARLLGWSERLIGLTIVSAGTGLPELVASVISALKGRSDVALGNVIGSNLFNILGSLGICGLVTPLPIAPQLFEFDCVCMLAITVTLFPLMYTGLQITRREGAVLLALYGGYLGYLIFSA